MNDLYIILLQCVTPLRYIVCPIDQKCQRLFSFFLKGGSFVGPLPKLFLDLLASLD